jgi:hypothetical protein
LPFPELFSQPDESKKAKKMLELVRSKELFQAWIGRTNKDFLLGLRELFRLGLQHQLKDNKTTKPKKLKLCNEYVHKLRLTTRILCLKGPNKARAYAQTNKRKLQQKIKNLHSIKKSIIFFYKSWSTKSITIKSSIVIGRENIDTKILSNPPG